MQSYEWVFLTSGLFDGFKLSDFFAFKDEKQEDPRFNDERKIVRDKMKALQSRLEVELRKMNFPLEGKVSLSGINYCKPHVSGIWLAYTDVKPFYEVCQLNCGIYNDGFFAGIEINRKAKSHLDNVAKFVKDNKNEFLSYVRELDPEFVDIAYGDWGAGPSKIGITELEGLQKALESEPHKHWFRLGEWYPKTERFLTTSEVVLRIPRIFEVLFPLYLVFAGHRPVGHTKVERLLRKGDVSRAELARTEKELVPEINKLTEDELNDLIAEIDRRNKSTIVGKNARKAETYRRNAVLSSALKRKYEDVCQVCGHTHKIERGFFCDTHHLKSLRAGGLDVSENILVLCPNHHRIFDRSHSEITSRNKSKIVIKVGGHTFEAFL